MLPLVAVTVTLMVLMPVAHGQIPWPGKCPTVTVQQNFDPAKYAGLWYEYKKYHNIYEIGGTCISATYTVTSDPNKMTILNRQYSTPLSVYTTMVGTATLQSSTKEAKLSVSFPATSGYEFDYSVLGTDYTSYAVVSSCTDIYLASFRLAWILTRERLPPSSVIKAAEAVAKSKGLWLLHLSLTPQRDCVGADDFKKPILG